MNPGTHNLEIQSNINKNESSKVHSIAFLGEDVEKWPLVQAYALDDFGGHGFLSMKKRVVDLRKQMETLLFTRLDMTVCSGMLADDSSKSNKNIVGVNKNYGGNTNSSSAVVSALEKPWKEAITNARNQEACVQHFLYGLMNEEELLEALYLLKKKLKKNVRALP